MAYFANGTEGDAFEAQYCARCIHNQQCEMFVEQPSVVHVTFAESETVWQSRPLDTSGGGEAFVDLTTPAESGILESSPNDCDTERGGSRSEAE